MQNMRKIRKSKHMTLVAVQVETGIDHSLLSKYERGERIPTVDNLMVLAKLYHTNMEYLMDLTADSTPIV